MVPGAAGDVDQVPLGGLDVLAVDMKDHPAFAPDEISRLVQRFLVAVNLVPVAALAGEGKQLEKLRRKEIRGSGLLLVVGDALGWLVKDIPPYVAVSRSPAGNIHSRGLPVVFLSNEARGHFPAPEVEFDEILVPDVQEVMVAASLPEQYIARADLEFLAIDGQEAAPLPNQIALVHFRVVAVVGGALPRRENDDAHLEVRCFDQHGGYRSLAGPLLVIPLEVFDISNKGHGGSLIEVTNFSPGGLAPRKPKAWQAGGQSPPGPRFRNGRFCCGLFSCDWLSEAA